MNFDLDWKKINLYEFKNELRQKARIYSNKKNIFSVFTPSSFPLKSSPPTSLFSIILLVIFNFLDLSDPLFYKLNPLLVFIEKYNAVLGLVIIIFIIFILLTLFLYLLNLPLLIYSNYYLEKKYNLSKYNLKNYLKDQLKTFLYRYFFNYIIISALLTVIFIISLVFENNWLYSYPIFLSIFVFFDMKISTNKVNEMEQLYDIEILKDNKVREMISKITRDNNIPKIYQVYIAKTGNSTDKPNAYFFQEKEKGKIYLLDNLYEKFSYPELNSMIAHEIGHKISNDTKWKSVFNSVMLLSSTYGVIFLNNFLNTNQIDFFLILMLLLIFNLSFSPIIMYFNRIWEYKADKFALKQIDEKEHFISTMKKLGDLSLEDHKPNIIYYNFLYTHPSLSKRIKLANKLK